MKKITTLMLALLFISVASCKRDRDDNQPKQKSLAEIIVGGWELTKMEVKGKPVGQPVDLVGTGTNFTGVATFKANPKEISSTASATINVRIVIGGTEIPFGSFDFENVFDKHKYEVINNQQIRLISPEQVTINMTVKAFTDTTIDLEFTDLIEDEDFGQVSTTFNINMRKK